MERIRYKILRHAQIITKESDSLDHFFNEHGIDIKQVRKNPDYYEDLIMQYSRNCIAQELFRESRERLEEEINRICDFHRKNEEQLVQQFYDITKALMKEEYKGENK